MHPVCSEEEEEEEEEAEHKSRDLTRSAFSLRGHHEELPQHCSGGHTGCDNLCTTHTKSCYYRSVYIQQIM